MIKELQDETMEENSIEKITFVENEIKNTRRLFEEVGCHTFFDEDLCKAIEQILSDYKRVLKENEELLQEKINNQKIIVLAQNDMLNYQAGFEDGKNGRTSAVQNIIENQQYYIFQKQVEKYEEHIEKLQKENEELKEYIATAPNLDEMTATKYRNIQQKAYIQGRAEEQQKAEQIIYENYIPKQTVKDKIEEILNNGEYTIIFEGDAEFPDEATRIDAQKYIKLEKLQELVEGRK